MTTYRFDCVLGPVALTDALTDAIYEAGCDDTTVSSRDGIVAVRFRRDAESLDAAVRSALRDLAKAGCRTTELRLDTESVQSFVETPQA